jgi:hypothetical protein
LTIYFSVWISPVLRINREDCPVAYYFFPATRFAAAQITDLFDFVWPTAAALWNLRWQVSGFLKEVPESTPKQLNDRFVFGSGIHGTNLRKSCIDTNWDSQKHNLATVTLTNAFSIYEHWADALLASVGEGKNQGKLLQRDVGPKGEPGLVQTVQHICTRESKTLTSAFYPVFCASPKHSWKKIRNLIACYRYFKELRNAQMHNGGKVDAKAAAAYVNFAGVSKKEDLGMRGELLHDPAVLGGDVHLHLRGVVGFCDVLLRMMVTIDAELSRSERADAVLEAAFKNAKLISTFSPRANARHMQVLGCCKRAGLPPPSGTKEVEVFLIEKRLVSR